MTISICGIRDLRRHLRLPWEHSIVHNASPVLVCLSFLYGCCYSQREDGIVPRDALNRNPTMTNPAAEIFREAQNGGIAAIIQVLNHKLADSGVRTRAVIEEAGVLQVLCEASSAAELEQQPLVEKIQRILTDLTPRNIKRVHLHSRLVQEQQILWLEEIKRSPEQLLWQQEILVQQPSPWQRWLSDRAAKAAEDNSLAKLTTAPSRRVQARQQLLKGGLLGILTTLGAMGACWLAYSYFFPRTGPTTALKPTDQALKAPPLATVTPDVSGPDPAAAAPGASQPQQGSSPSPSLVAASAPSTAASANPDPFAAAVRLAEKTAAEAKQVSSPDQWRAIADQWQQAAELMAQVPPAHPRYAIAQDRAASYQKNSETARQKAL